MKHLAQPGTRNALDFLNDWYLAENQRFRNLEFFNRIGQLRSFEQTNKRSDCASFVKVIASIQDPAVIKKILAHLDGKVRSAATALLPDCRASPTGGWLIRLNK